MKRKTKRERKTKRKMSKRANKVRRTKRARKNPVIQDNRITKTHGKHRCLLAQRIEYGSLSFLQRILLFNSYASWAMCKAGLPVLDVHPVSDSFAPGAGDVVHYPDFVFSNAEKALEIFKTNELNGKKRFHRTKMIPNAAR